MSKLEQKMSNMKHEIIEKTDRIERKVDSIDEKLGSTINSNIAQILNKQSDMNYKLDNVNRDFEKNDFEHKKFDYEIANLKRKCR